MSIASSRTALSLLFLIASSRLCAQSQNAASPDPGKWQVTLSPYLMLPWMNGTTAVRGNEVDVDVSPGDIFKNLQFGVMTGFEAKKSRWGFGADIVYMALGATVDRDPLLGDRAGADVDVNQGAYTFMGLRELNSKCDLVFGARWNVISGRIGLKGPQQTVVKQTKMWLDPIVGFKVKQPLVGKVHFQMEGDIGGFGAGSDFAWNLFPMIGMDVSKKMSLGLGYRVLSMNYKSGGQTDYFKYDVVTQAFVLGASLHF